MNILILEDEEVSRQLLEILLTRHGYRSKAVGSVLQAFEHLRKGLYDLILMDLGLPGLDGISFTRKLKKYPEFRDIPVIAMTGTPREFMEATAVRAGCDAFLEKPVDTDALLKTISTFESMTVEGQMEQKTDALKK
ncbi:MAG TPA: response regulator [Bacteroidota bacterium]|nr:response regulator [Bacteroidota bacterium]